MKPGDIEFIEDNIYYLNISELKRLTEKLNIPINIYIEKTKDLYTKTNQIDLKSDIIKKILKYLSGKRDLKPTIYKYKVINFDPVYDLTKNSFVYYGQYNSTNKEILKLMKQLTNDHYKFGADSNYLIRKIWSKGKLITYEEFAELWLKDQKRNRSHPEWRYLDDLKNGDIDMQQWKQQRKKIALQILKKLTHTNII